MTIEFEQESGPDLGLDAESLMTRVALAALDYAEFPFEAEISMLITDNDGIREINRSQRGIDAPTDVLSFPMVDYPAAGDFSVWEDDTCDAFNPDSGEALLGDIVISADRVLAQAAEYGHSVERELAFLTAHSMFHLFGYDHMTDEDRVVMEAKQKELMDILGIAR